MGKEVEATKVETKETVKKGSLIDPEPEFRKIRRQMLSEDQKNEIMGSVQNNTQPTLLEYCTPKNVEWIFTVCEKVAWELTYDMEDKIDTYDSYVYLPLILSMRFDPVYLMSVNTLYLSIVTRINALYNVCPEIFHMTGWTVYTIDESVKIENSRTVFYNKVKDYARIMAAENQDCTDIRKNLL